MPFGLERPRKYGTAVAPVEAESGQPTQNAAIRLLGAWNANHCRETLAVPAPVTGRPAHLDTASGIKL